MGTDSAIVSEADVASPTPAYAWYVTGLLMVAYTFSFLDRQILNMMVGPIKHDLGISDFQFSLLSGAAFGVFYTIVGLPLGWLADRFSRKWIVTLGVAAWSLMTASCGLSHTFQQLFGARVGVGVGEASLSPSAYSMLSDCFDRKRLPRAMSVYTSGIFFGAGIALIVGGEVVAVVHQTPLIVLPVIGTLRSWQAVFMIVGLPGVLLALWIASVREPARRGRTDATPIRELIGLLTRYPRLFAALFIGSGFYSILGYADAWFPELFIRTWGWDAALAGRVNGTISLIAGPAGLLFAGWYSSWMMARGQSDACLRLTAYGALGITLPSVLMPLMPNSVLMAGMLLPIKFCVGFPPVLIASALQMVAPNRQRAQLGAIFLFACGIIGVSCGPMIPAILTDYVFHDEHALRYSLAWSAGLVGPIAAIILWQGLGQFRERLDTHDRSI